MSEAFQLASGRWLRHRLVNQVKTRLRLSLRVLTALHKVSRCFWQRVYPMPRVSPLNSQVAFRSQVSDIVFDIADSRKVFTGHAWTPCPPRCLCSFCPAFQRLFLVGRPCFQDRQSHPPVLMHSSNRLPSGNCDSLRPETILSYLTRFGTVSHRSSSLSPFFAFTDSARTPPEELVNSASAPEPHDPA